MKWLALTALSVLVACTGGPRAPDNPDSVPNVLLSITQARESEDAYILLQGGLNTGAAVGQTAIIMVLPDDRVLCTFETIPVLPVDGGVTTVTAHRLIIPGAFANLSTILLPNITPSNTDVTANFNLETGSPAGRVTTGTGFGDPRFGQLFTYFNNNPAPCWAFG